jgi:hypothetical protein
MLCVFVSRCVFAFMFKPMKFRMYSHLDKIDCMLPLGHNRVGQLGIMNIIGFPVNNEGAYYVPTPLRVHDLPQGVQFQQVLCVCVYAVCLCVWCVSVCYNNIFEFIHMFLSVQVSAGWGHSALITEDGAVYTCGRNVHGQLGLGPPSNFPLNERGHPYLVRSSCVFVYISGFVFVLFTQVTFFNGTNRRRLQKSQSCRLENAARLCVEASTPYSCVMTTTWPLLVRTVAFRFCFGCVCK